MINKELNKLCGAPLDASAGKLTRSDNAASSRPTTVDLGMGEFNPRNGANTNGPYIVKGVSTPGGGGPSRSSRRSAGAAPDASA